MDRTDFIMEIEEIDRNASRGFVATGKVKDGIVYLGDSLEIVGNNNILRTHIAFIEKETEQPKEHIMSSFAKTGEKVRLLLTNSRSDDIRIGQVISTPKTIRPHFKFEAEISLLNEKDYLENFVSGSFDGKIKFRKDTKSKTKITLLDNIEHVSLSDSFHVLIEMSSALAFKIGCEFAIYKNSKKIGTGIVTSIVE